MRVGEVIKGYYIVTEPTNSGGGMCMWAFAVKNRWEYFLKEFLQPKWPTPGSMGSEAGKAQYKLRTICELIHARWRNWDLRQVTVRGMSKVGSVVLWYALTNNVLQGYRLLAQQASQ